MLRSSSSESFQVICFTIVVCNGNTATQQKERKAERGNAIAMVATATKVATATFIVGCVVKMQLKQLEDATATTSNAITIQ